MMNISSSKKCSKYLFKFILWMMMSIISRSILRLPIFLRTKSIIVSFLLCIYKCSICLWYFFKYLFRTYFMIDRNLQQNFYQDEILMLISYRLFLLILQYSFWTNLEYRNNLSFSYTYLFILSFIAISYHSTYSCGF